MDGDAYPKGFSAPLASGNIGQLGLRHGLNTNKLSKGYGWAWRR